MNKRYLIISADDYGISEGTNEAIAELFREEKITSAGILAPAPYVKQAASEAKAGGWSTGVHWTLRSDFNGTDAWTPCAKEGHVSSLTPGGKLPKDPAVIRKAASRDVTLELEAQYRYLLSCGVTPDHADSHGGDLYGINGRLFFFNAFSLCRKYGLPFRFAKADAFLERQFSQKPGSALRFGRRMITCAARVRKVSLLDDFFSDPRKAAAIDTPESLKAYYASHLMTLEGRICEVFLHPCRPGDVFESTEPSWKKRVWEYQYLKSGELTRLAIEQGFIPVSWKEAPFND